MNPAQRTALIIAAVIAVVGVFLLTQGDEGGSDQTLSPAETVANDGTETAEGTGGAEAPPTETQTTTTQTAPPPPPRVESIRIRDGQPASGKARTLKYDSGDTVRLRFSSNAASEIHIHGYDKYVNVPAGGSEQTRFKADAEGIFEIEDHGTGALLAKLEVRP